MKFAALSIRKAGDLGWKPVHFLNSVSANIENVFKPAGIERSTGIITAQYLKDATDPQWEKNKDYQEWLAWMKKYNPGVSTADVFYVFGYAAADTLVRVLKQCGDDLTRANVMKQATNLKDVEIPMLLPGIRITTAPNDYFPIEAVRLSRFDGTTFKLFGEIINTGSR